MNAGETKVVRLGRPGIRDVTYLFVFENSKLTHKRIKNQDVLKKPRPKVVRIGTKIPDGVWDRLAQCESGGNWHINTGNGYYGGLQFSLGTWHAYGGTGLPSQHSRETQIAIATKLRNASGGYGAVARHCASRRLGVLTVPARTCGVAPCGVRGTQAAGGSITATARGPAITLPTCDACSGRPRSGGWPPSSTFGRPSSAVRTS